MDHPMRHRPGTSAGTAGGRIGGLMLAVWSVWAVLVSGPAWAQGAAPVAAPIPVERFFALPDLSSPQLSPSGRYLAVLVRGQGDRNRLAVIDLQGDNAAKGLAGYGGLDIVNLQWVSDDWLVYSLQEDLRVGERRYYAPGLLSISRETGKTRVLVTTLGRQFVRTDSEDDGRLPYNHVLLSVPQDGSDEVILGEASLSPRGLIESLRPLRLNVRNGSTRHIVPAGAPPAAAQWWFDVKGEPQVAATGRDGRVQVHRRGAPDAPWRVLLDAPAHEPPWQPHSVNAQGELLVTWPSGEDGTAVLGRLDAQTGKPEPRPLFSVPGFDFLGDLVREHATGRLLGARVLSDGESTVWLDPVLQDLQRKIDQRLPDRVNRLSCRRCGTPEAVVLVSSFSDRDPGTYYIWRPQGPGAGLQRLGRHLAGIEPARMAPVSLEDIKARDGRRLPVWLTVPRRAAGAPPPPAVVLVHGGPWMRGRSWEWEPWSQLLASRGWAVIEPEFRGSTGYGQAHFRAGWRQWGQAMQDDLIDALQWAQAQGHVDPRRVCIMGGSYGGYAALMGLARDGDRFRCGVAMAAPSDLNRMVDGSWWWPDDLSDESRRYGWNVLIGDAKADADPLRANSPLRLAARIQAPLLLVHGEKDARVPFVHALDLRKALQAQGREPEWLSFPDEGHGWSRTDNLLTLARRVEAFLSRHLAEPSARP